MTNDANMNKDATKTQGQGNLPNQNKTQAGQPNAQPNAQQNQQKGSYSSDSQQNRSQQNDVSKKSGSENR